MAATINPNISIISKFSLKNIHAIIAVTGGIKKNKLAVLLADPVFIKYISIENAPKDITIICQDNAIMKSFVN